ncbi:hypothetical protein [Haloferax sp. Q22]|uniref:hypothetical protein n=1 Tax=Haloferax sp. (strain Q22) TaxID=1526048 RepID=UPI00155E1BAE|nr:hypothetical protein [Haloferax sp. Q22]
MTSINAYYELKEEGKISERQELAFMAVRNFYDEKGYWPTPKEVHAFLAVEQGNELAQFEGPNLVKPRITELLEDPEDDDPDLLEKKDVSRSQEYIEELLDDYSSKKATPVKIAEKHLDRQDIEGSEGDEDSEEVEEQQDENEVDDEEDDEDSPEPGELLYGSEDEDSGTDSEDAVDDSEEDSEDRETMTMDGVEYKKNEDGVWVSEDGQEYLFPPGIDEEEYLEDQEDSQQEESSDDVDQQNEDREKEEKQPSVNQF